MPPATLLPDGNVLVAGFRPGHPHHARARAFLAGARDGRDALGLPDLVLASTVRLVTSARVFADPSGPDEALDYVAALLEPPGVLLTGSDAVWRRVDALCREHGSRANEVPDAHLAAYALEHRADLVTFDRGFARFRGLRWRVPGDG